MRKVVILQARLGSSRFPKRVLADLSGKPVVVHIIERLKVAQGVDEICAAIPKGQADDELAEVLGSCGVTIVRGSEYDVLGRFIQAAYQTKADVVCRVKADDPLVSIAEIEAQLALFDANPDLEYASGTGFPLGVAPESFRLKTLEKLDYLSKHEEMRTRVTLYLHRNPGPFVIHEAQAPPELARPDLNLSVNTTADYNLVQAIYDRLYSEGHPVDVADAVKLVDGEPELKKLADLAVKVPAAS